MPSTAQPSSDDPQVLLHAAALANDIHRLALLAADGTNLNAANEQGTTALHIAAMNGQTHAVNALLKYGTSGPCRPRSPNALASGCGQRPDRSGRHADGPRCQR